jgi:hypothetical protein
MWGSSHIAYLLEAIVLGESLVGSLAILLQQWQDLIQTKGAVWATLSLDLDTREIWEVMATRQYMKHIIGVTDQFP